MSVVKRCLPILLLVLCGCSLEHPHPSNALYVLPSSELEHVPSAQPVVLEIGRAHVAPPFDSRMFQYRVGDAIRATLLDAHGSVLMVREDRRELPSVSEQPADIIAAWAAGVSDVVRALIPELQAALGGD